MSLATAQMRCRCRVDSNVIFTPRQAGQLNQNMIWPKTDMRSWSTLRVSVQRTYSWRVGMRLSLSSLTCSSVSMKHLSRQLAMLLRGSESSSSEFDHWVYVGAHSFRSSRYSVTAVADLWPLVATIPHSCKYRDTVVNKEWNRSNLSALSRFFAWLYRASSSSVRRPPRTPAWP